MKKTLAPGLWIPFFGILTLLAGPSSASATEENNVVVDGEVSAPSAIGCAIWDSSGSPVTTINAFVSGSAAYTYWIVYWDNGWNATGVQTTVAPLFNSVLRRQRQLFNLYLGSTNFGTPFGIPSWGYNATLGSWRLTVKANGGGVAYCDFTVEAP